MYKTPPGGGGGEGGLLPAQGLKLHCNVTKLQLNVSRVAEILLIRTGKVIIIIQLLI